MKHVVNDADSLCYALLYLKSELYAMGLEKSALLVGSALEMVEKELALSDVDKTDHRIFKDFIEKALKLDKETLSNLVAFLVEDDKELVC